MGKWSGRQACCLTRLNERSPEARLFSSAGAGHGHHQEVQREVCRLNADGLSVKLQLLKWTQYREQPMFPYSAVLGIQTHIQTVCNKEMKECDVFQLH